MEVSNYFKNQMQEDLALDISKKLNTNYLKQSMTWKVL